VSQDQFSQDQFPPDQLSRDQLATRSTLIYQLVTRSTQFFKCFYWTRQSWGKHQKVMIMLKKCWTRNNGVPQISIVVTMFLVFTYQMMHI